MQSYMHGFHLEGAARITVAARNEKAIDSLKELFPYAVRFFCIG